MEIQQIIPDGCFTRTYHYDITIDELKNAPYKIETKYNILDCEFALSLIKRKRNFTEIRERLNTRIRFLKAEAKEDLLFHRIHNRCWRVFRMLMDCVENPRFNGNHPYAQTLENDDARLLSVDLFEIDRIWIGLETPELFAQRGNGVKPSIEHFYPRQVAGLMLIEAMRDLLPNAQTFEKALPYFYLFIQIIKSTSEENSKFKNQQKLANFKGPVEAYRQLGILPLVRTAESYNTPRWERMAKQYDVNLQIYNEFPEIPEEEAEINF